MILATVPRTLGDNLAWVRGALDEHLAQVRNHIQLHVQDSRQEYTLVPALLQMQQLRGVLRMIQCYGSLILVEEMIQALEGLTEGAVQEREIVLEVLLGATLQLADYFDLLRAGKADGALVFHPVINELRMAVGRPVLSERDLFVEYIRRAEPAVGTAPLPERQGMERAVASKLARAFQSALLGWLREGRAESLQQLSRIGRFAQGAVRNPRLELSWNALQVVLDGLRSGTLQPTLELKRLLGQMGQGLTRLADHDDMDPALDPGDLPFSLLYYVGRCEPRSDAARRLYDQYALETILPDEQTLSVLREGLRGPNTELLHRLSDALKEDLSGIKDSLDLMARSSQPEYEDIDEIREASRRVAETLNMLGLASFGHVMQQQMMRLQEMARIGAQDADAWMDVATALLQLEQGLDDALFRQLLMRDAVEGDGADGEPAASADFKSGLTAMLQEASVNMARLQEFVRSYLSDGEAVLLTEAARLLEEIKAGLHIIGYSEPAELAGELRGFLGNGASHLRQDRHLAETLADAVAAFEFYLQAQKTGRAQAPHLLDQVRVAVEQLQAGPSEESEPLPDMQSDAPGEALNPEIREVFLEEAREVLKDLSVRVPRWRTEPAIDDDLTAIRRAFHTLKGSGRMVGAQSIGEFGWALENLLNRCLEGALPITDAIVDTVVEALGILPQLLHRFDAGQPADDALDALASRAHELAQVKMAGESEAASGDAEAHEPETAPDTGESDDERELRQVFWGDAYRRVSVLNHLLGPEAGERPDVSAVMRAMHVLRGSAETAGVQGVARLAGALEGFLESVRSLRCSIEGVIRDLLVESNDALHEELEALKQAGGGAAADRDGLITRIRTQQVRLTREAARYGVGVEVMEGFTDEAIGHVEKVEQSLGAWLDNPRQSDTLQAAETALSELTDTARTANATAALEAADALKAWVACRRAESAVPWEGLREAIARVMDDLYVMLDRYRAGESGFGAEALDRLNGLVPPATVAGASGVPCTGGTSTPAAMPGVDSELLDIFSGEAAELLTAIGQQLSLWREGGTASLQELRRALHTLKGSARMAGAMELGEVSHEMETLVDSVRAGETDGPALERISAGVERMHALLDAILRGPVEDETEGGAEPAPPPRDTEVAGSPAPAEEAAESPAARRPEAPERKAQPAAAWAPGLFETESDSTQGERVSFGDNARVAVAQLRSMLDDAGEISILRSRLEQQGSVLQLQLNEMQRTIQRTREQLRNLELETEASILARHPGSEGSDADPYEDFDPLEMDRYTRIQELSRALTESVTDLNSLHGLMHQATGETDSLLLQQGRVNASLQQGLMGTLLVPFVRQVPRLKRLVSQICDESGKQAKVSFEGTDAEMDRTVLERMTAPLEHVLRNAVVHGVEGPDERAAAGKPEQGSIQVLLRREAAQLLIEIGDDGRGLDLQAIKKRAQSLDMLASGTELEEAKLANFILEAGFTTAETVSRDAGRGVGLDVANTTIRQLGGSLGVHTQPGRGARFVIRLPLSLAISQTLLARVGDELYALPLSGIEGITRVASKTLVRYFEGAQAHVTYGGEEYALRYFGDLIEVGRPVVSELPRYLPVLVIKAGDERVGLVPDALLSRQEVVVKSVGPQVSTVPGVSGATVMADGRVVLIIDPAALLRAEARRSAVQAEAVAPLIRHATAHDQNALVLVVDDSITIRRVSERLLTRNGMRVATARDGMDALGKLQTEVPDLVLLDIEMPRIDGFEVATYMRNTPDLRDVPIVMITSRSGDKHRNRARAIGVDRYLTKPYQEEELLAEIEALIPGALKRETP